MQLSPRDYDDQPCLRTYFSSKENSRREGTRQGWSPAPLRSLVTTERGILSSDKTSFLVQGHHSQCTGSPNFRGQKSLPGSLLQMQISKNQPLRSLFTKAGWPRNLHLYLQVIRMLLICGHFEKHKMESREPLPTSAFFLM